MLLRLLFGLEVEPGDHATQSGVRSDLGRVEEQFSAPDQARLLAQLHDVLEDALEDGQAQALPNPRQAGVVGQRFIQAIAQVPAVGQMQARRLDQAALRANAFKEQDELELEEDDGVDGRPAPGLVELLDPRTDEGEIQLGIEVPVEVVSRDEILQRDHDRPVNGAEFGRTEHCQILTFGCPRSVAPLASRNRL
jgi:hypothetical protein